jgi:hypothetical protein
MYSCVRLTPAMYSSGDSDPCAGEYRSADPVPGIR